MKKVGRAFMALDLPPQAIEMIREIQSRFRAGLPHFRWVSPQNIHLTLHFLGEITWDKILQLEERTRPLLSEQASFPARLGIMGVFPRWSDPRVLWLSLEGSLEPLFQLQKETGQIIKALGHPLESRAFSPHITLARIPAQATASEASLRELKAYSPDKEKNGFILSSLTLYSSELTPRGPVYTPCFSIKLKEIKSRIPKPKESQT